MERTQKNCETLKHELTQKSQLLDASERKANMFEAQFKAEHESNKKMNRQFEELNTTLREIKQTHKTELQQQADDLNAKNAAQITSQKRQFDVMLDDHRKAAAEEVGKRDVEIDALKKIIGSLQGKIAIAEKTPKRRSTVKKASPIASSFPTVDSPTSDGDVDEHGDHDVKAMQDELSRTRKELDALNRNWESRFNVLRASLHEIKDESFLRKRIEYQPLALHTSSYPAHDNNSSHLRQSTEGSSHVLPPLKPGHVKKGRTTELRKQIHAFSPAMSDNFSSGSDTDAAESDTDTEFRPLKHQPSNRTITR